jgi:hypothetical protein
VNPSVSVDDPALQTGVVDAIKLVQRLLTDDEGYSRLKEVLREVR